jgi:uncharacterized membrane protein (Fun14 family)
MSTPSPESLRWANAHSHFLTHLRVMPGWHKAVILLGGVLAVMGTVGQIAARTGGDARSHVTTNSQPSSSNGFVSATDSRDAEPAPSPLTRLSPHATRIGLSIILGFVIGWLFRAFLKTMVLLALLVGGGLWLLAHFNILHIGDDNLQAIKDKSGQAASWLGAQASHLKDLAIAHLPSTGGGALGAFLGIRRR